jgi:predicted ArsR family transcriptional regulator
MISVRQRGCFVQPIRRRIAEILKSQGTATVAELAEQLNMAQVSVRHHLDILIGEDLVIPASLRRHAGAGRPSQVYALTPEATKLFPQRSTMLANGMLDEMKSVLTAHEVRALLLRLAEKTAGAGPRLDPDAPVDEQLSAISDYLTREGYDAHWELHDDEYELHACNCPYVGVADHHPELCMMDQAIMQHLMPDLIRLESRVLDGAPHCRYIIHHSAVDNSEALG